MAKKTTAKPKSAEKNQLHSYQKVIVRPGTYRVPARKSDPKAYQDASGKWVKDETFSNTRLTNIAATAKEMLDGGFKIPAPFVHRDKNGKIPRPFKVGGDGASLDALTEKPIAWDASINGGHWRDLQFVDDVSKINPEFESGPGLVGMIDTFGDPNDLNTPAGKVSRTVQDTSILTLPNYKPPMGDKVYDDYIAHIAMPVHAIEPGQDNFAEVAAMSDEENEFAIVSMSDLVTDLNGGVNGENDDPEMAEVVSFLQQLKIDLPPETTRDNLVSVLRILLRQKIADQREMTPENPLTNAPNGSSTKPAPVAMSDTLSGNSATAEVLLKREIKRVKDNLRGRLLKLRRQGGHDLSEEVVAELEADINAIQMSADDLNDEGDFPTSLAEKQIALLERTRRPLVGSIVDDYDAVQMSAPDGSHLEEPPIVGIPAVPDDYVAGILDRAMPAGSF